MVFLIIGIFLSKSPQAGVYGLIKFFEFVFLGFYVAHNIKKLKFENILLVFSAGIIFESFLAIAQYLNHGSLQGIFYFFGERFFNAQTLGIANASLDGELFLRPYATFSHPNVLAGYLIVAMTLIFSGIKSYESRIKGIIFILTLIIGTIVLLLTLSRVTILLWLIVIGSWFMVKIYTKLKRKFSIFHILLSIFALIAVGWLFLKSPLHVRFTDVKLSDESIVQRESLVQSSIAMIKDRPILGVGLNNFLINLPSYQKPMSPLFSLQPVHNLFLLVVAETGLVGLIFFVWFIFKTFSRIKNHESRIKGRFIILSSILILGMFDHYFLTLQQGQLLLSFVLGLCWSEKVNRAACRDCKLFVKTR